MNERLHVWIEGRVQGVWFRQSTRERAHELGVVGWVRNLPDRRVEVVAEGPRIALEALLAFCREGPPMARVHGVEFTWESAEGTLETFDVTR